ncbi:MAG: hypothetical protein WC423_25240 [Vulcanimicrobiota bacterium]
MACQVLKRCYTGLVCHVVYDVMPTIEGRIEVKGLYEGRPVTLTWEDGTICGTDWKALATLARNSVIHDIRGGVRFPPRRAFVHAPILEDPRGFLCCAEDALEDMSSNWKPQEPPTYAEMWMPHHLDGRLSYGWSAKKPVELDVMYEGGKGQNS